ncbi:hypothetical protein [Cupriavidus necator]|uniref:hypothetical protein n=1 Tax=Cupriavidus necator TaxID=106590 RepID=UPI00148F9122|nr:hypothetical protein [Cupriavidus necator]
MSQRYSLSVNLGDVLSVFLVAYLLWNGEYLFAAILGILTIGFWTSEIKQERDKP